MHCLERTVVSVFLLKYIAGTPDNVPALKMSVTRVSERDVELVCLIFGGQVDILIFQRKDPLEDELVNIAEISVYNKCVSKSAVNVTCSCLKRNEVICNIPVHTNEAEHSWRCALHSHGFLHGSNIVNTSGKLKDNKVISINNNNDSSTTEDITISTIARPSSESGIVLICVALVILLGVGIAALRHRRSLRYWITRARNGFGNNVTVQASATRESLSANAYNTYLFAKSVDGDADSLAELSQPDPCHSIPRGVHSEIYSLACNGNINSVSSMEGEQNGDQDRGYAEIECKAELMVNNDVELNPDSLVTEFDMDDLQYVAGGLASFGDES